MVPDQETHQNFSTVGMVLVLCLGGFLILLSIVIDPPVADIIRTAPPEL
jgi:hypothetical protein